MPRLSPRDVALARPQAAELGVDIVGLLAQVLLLAAQLYQAVLDIDLSLLHARTRFSNLPPAHGEMLGGVHGLQLGLGQQPAETLGTRLPLRRRSLGRGDHALELGDPVPAVPGSLQVEAGFLVPQLGQPGVVLVAGGKQPSPFGIEVLNVPFQEAGLGLGEEEPRRRPLCRRRLDVGRDRVVRVAISQQRPERQDLGLGAANGLVRVGQVLEVRHDLRGPGGRVERFQHVLADEAGEVTDGLHGHGLVEQLQGLLGFDAEPAPEIPAVLGEAVVHTGTGRAQPFLQRSDLRAEVGEIRRDGQVPLGDDEEPLRLALMAVLQPEHLSQGDRRPCSPRW